MAHGTAHCLGRGRNPLAPERPGQGAVCGDRAVGDLQQQAPHRLAEGAALGGQRRQSREGSLGKIGVQPGGGLLKYRQVIFLYSIWESSTKVFLPIQPQPCEGCAVRGEGQHSHRGGLMKDHPHTITPQIRIRVMERLQTNVSRSTGTA